MVKDQQEAEKKKVQSQEIQQQLAVQTIAINQKRDDVMADLALVEPAVIDAQTGMYLQWYFLLYHYTNLSTSVVKINRIIIEVFQTFILKNILEFFPINININ